MRILYSHRVQSRDGQGVHIEELLNALRNAGHEVLVVGPGAYQKAELGGESAIIAGIRRILPSALIELAEIFYNIPTSLRLWRACKTFRPDFIYERYNLYHLAGVLTKWRGHVPLYLEVNAPLAEERKRFGNLKLGYLAKMLEHLVWRSADRVFVVTEVLKETVAGTGVERGRITVIPNGVDRDVFPAVPYRPRPGAPIVIGFIGFVRDWHGLDGVIAGLAQPSEPPIHLTIVGDGPARPSLERQAKALGVEGQVKFFGVKQRASIPDLIQRFDIALQPQAVSYASPLKLFEYMAAGRAIVAPDQPNIREILSGDETAILFDPKDSAALWCAIRRLAANPELRERLGRAARLALNAHDYTWQANAGRVIAAVAGDLGAQSVSVSDGPALDLPVRREPR